MVISSTILAGDRGIPEEVLAESGAAANGPAAGGFEFGVDPSLDPELAMVPTYFPPSQLSDNYVLGSSYVDGRGASTTGRCCSRSRTKQ